MASGASFRRAASHLASGDGHHRVEAGLGLHVLVDEEGLRDGGRVREAGPSSTMIASNLPLRFIKALDDADEVAAHGAADAAVVHLEDFLVRADDEVVVDADLAELVDDHRELLAMRLGEDSG